MQSAKFRVQKALRVFSCLLILMGLLATTQAGAQEARSPAFQVLNEVRIEQRIGEQVPLDAIFRNSIGETVKL